MDRLREIMGESGRPCVRVRWELAPQQVGVQFPSDFRDFIEAYGSVEFSGGLVVVAPQLGEKAIDAYIDDNKAVGESLEQWYGLLPENGRPYEPFPAPGGLLLWGNDLSANYFFWDTSDSDPERWPVVIWYYGSEPLETFNGGVSDFLTSLLTGAHPESDELIDQSPGAPLWRHRV
ncbi:SMI1/KNR4 family protein [Kitasatospora sp. KL5]|uniref:SMI1/KNR4 family protein n=1 Tax=Kitasatospora sp. KL5 TaxID=3425125 RepID=UPI003D7017F6